MASRSAWSPGGVCPPHSCPWGFSLLTYSIVSVKQLVCIFFPFYFCVESGFICNSDGSGFGLKYILTLPVLKSVGVCFHCSTWGGTERFVSLHLPCTWKVPTDLFGVDAHCQVAKVWVFSVSASRMMFPIAGANSGRERSILCFKHGYS